MTVKLAHAVVWVDHQEAKIIHLNAEENGTPEHVKHASHDTPQAFYHKVAEHLKTSQEILVLGPGMAKGEFVKHLEAHDPAIAKAILGVEAADHPSEGQLVAEARKFFRAKDRMIAH